jgi:ABC-2 type transport system ATP-binding protein
MAAAIEVENLSKVFRLHREKYKSLKERALHFRKTSYHDFYALENINLDIEVGTTVGLLGHNGSGKSTLLKCMAGIIQPTSGSVRTVGRLAALLELGAGFHPDLTGRENVYLNGSILGLKRIEVDRIFDEIVGFAGLEQFIDTPVKFYSSGMYVRLGFAVAINVDPEILLVDEVLSVGDESFQRKCLDKVRSFQDEGRTIVVVTHSADLVRVMCQRGAALHHGVMVANGEPNDVIRAYRERLLQDASSAADLDPSLARAELSPVWHEVRIEETEIFYSSRDEPAVHPGESLRIDVVLNAAKPVDDVVVALTVYGPMGGLVHSTNTRVLGVDLGRVHGPKKMSFVIDQVPLLDGNYPVTIGLHTSGGLIYDFWEQERMFEVKAPGQSIGVVSLPIRVKLDDDGA